MYYIMFGGPDNVAYAGKARTKAESRAKVAELKRRKVPLIVVLWDYAPLAMLSRLPSGAYKVRDWD